jgi:death-on-curing protein
VTRYLTIEEVLNLHGLVLQQSGGTEGLRDQGLLESAVAQPSLTFGGEDLYPSLADKASALAYSLVRNHPFVDGNKRVGHAALETRLVLNGHELKAEVDDQEQVVLRVAGGTIAREEFTEWIRAHLAKLGWA